MAGFIKVEAKKFPTQQLNMGVDKDIFYDFKVKCKQRGIPMNVVIETFMNQYANGKYHLSKEDIIKRMKSESSKETLNTPVNKEIHHKFKNIVNANGMDIKYVIGAFIEDYATNDLVLEFTRK